MLGSSFFHYIMHTIGVFGTGDRRIDPLYYRTVLKVININHFTLFFLPTFLLEALAKLAQLFYHNHVIVPLLQTFDAC